MNENLIHGPTQKELLTPVQGKVYTPGEFDRKLTNGEILHSNVIACTTMTLSRFIQDIQGINMNQEQWVQTFPKKSKYVTKQFGPFKRTVEQKYDDPFWILNQNREYMSWQVGLRDTLFSIYPDAAEKIFEHSYSPILYLGREYAKTPVLETIDDLYTLIKNANTYNDKPPEDSFSLVAADILLKPLGSLENVRDVIVEASQRQGVQVIYGANGFDLYKARAQRVHKDSTFWSAECYKSRFPARFVTAVLPLGQYEQTELLAA